jgi:hypothetical protein
MSEKNIFFGNIDGVNDAFKKRPKKSVVPPSSGGIRKTVNVPAKKHGAPSAHTIVTEVNDKVEKLVVKILE